LPGQTGNRRLTGNFSHIDLLPTLLDLMGSKVPGDLPGSSKADAVRGAPLPDEDVFLFWHPQNPERTDSIKGQSWRGMVTPDGWKYAISPEEETGLMFNQEDDIWEQSNRVLDPSCKALQKELHARLLIWMRQQQDPYLHRV